MAHVAFSRWREKNNREYRYKNKNNIRKYCILEYFSKQKPYNGGIFLFFEPTVYLIYTYVVNSIRKKKGNKTKVYIICTSAVTNGMFEGEETKNSKFTLKNRSYILLEIYKRYWKSHNFIRSVKKTY